MTRAGRKRTGSAFRHGNHWDIRITYPDGTRSNRICLAPGTSEEMARTKAERLTEIAAKQGAPARPEPSRPRAEPLPDGTPHETVAEWAARWVQDRQQRGLTSAHDDLGRLRKWVFLMLGPLRMVSVAREDLERLVEDLDARVRGGELSWKTAKNTWGAVSKMFDDACRSKTLALRVRKDNPAMDVRGPDDGVNKSKAYLYPAEFLALVSCERVPIRWRRLFAAAVYTYTRAAELEALGPEDVDIEHQTLHIHRGIDRSVKSRGEVKETKTNNPRRIPIEPNVVGVLELLRSQPAGDRLIAMPPLCDLSARLRQYLEWAGVTRAELFVNDATRKQITFHDLRATGITWMAIRGDEAMRIMQRAGHADIATTMIYVREAESLRHGFGEVFPPLPAALLSSSIASEGPAIWANLRNDRYSLASPAGFESRGAAGIRQDYAGLAQESRTNSCATGADNCSETLERDGIEDEGPSPYPALHGLAEAAAEAAHLVGGDEATLLALFVEELEDVAGGAAVEAPGPRGGAL